MAYGVLDQCLYGKRGKCARQGCVRCIELHSKPLSEPDSLDLQISSDEIELAPESDDVAIFLERRAKESRNLLGRL